MTINDVRGLARLLTYTDTINLSNTDALKYLNIVYKDIENKIVSKVNEDFFYEEWTFDLVD